jgi:CheY-like chemotaxis protein
MVVLDLLRHEKETATIPIHIISGSDRGSEARALGANQAILKPAATETLQQLFAEAAEDTRRRQSHRKGTIRAARPDLSGRRVLIVDDDIRNIYSLTSVLEAQGADVLHAERGADGIEILEANPDIHIALVDIMMPDMDGYETMRRIRANRAIGHIPLVAVTAKAMKGDRQKCLDAGASDYISKPVDIDMLLALMRVQLERAPAQRSAVSA